MNTRDLIRLFRVTVGDTAKPYLRRDELVLMDLTEAQQEAARRARLFVDSTTSGICTIAFTAGAASMALDGRIVQVRRVAWAGRARPLQKVHRDDLDRMAPGWESHTGEPSHYVVGMETNRLRLYPKPAADGTAQLTVVREPLSELVNDTDDLELAPRYHRALIHWLTYRYYGTQDSEQRNDQKAEAALAAFTAEFGPPSTAQDEVWAELQTGCDADDGRY